MTNSSNLNAACQRTHQTSNLAAVPGPVGLYDPRYERDSCGVGCISDIKGRAHRKVVSDANKLLVRLTHRGAKQGEDGDGAGIMVGMPHRYFKKLSLSGQLSFLTLPPPGRYGVGMIFLPNGEENETRRIELMDNIERVIRSYGLSVLGWRSPLPTKSSILGPIGRATEPFPAQIFVCRPEDNHEESPLEQRANKRTISSIYDGGVYVQPLLDQYDPESSFSAFDFGNGSTETPPTELPIDLEKLLYLVRRRLARWTDMYVCSFSCRMVVYKGQLQSEQLFSYYDDLMDEDFVSYFAIVHARFSTNTFPTWDRAHPFRRIAHNGEINTIDCNRRWMIAKEGKASAPKSLGLGVSLSDIVPFEEPCHVTRFSLPKPPDMHTGSTSGKKKALAPVPCRGITHVRDSLAVPTDIVSARKSSVASNDSRNSSGSVYTDQLSWNQRDLAPYASQEDGDTDPSASCANTGPVSYSSDSASLDGTLELLMMAGRDIAEAVMLLVPEAVQKGEPQWKRDYYDFASCVMEPWDGPALVAFTDGVQLGAQLDRNGLRPGRFVLSKDGTLILASEVGVVDVLPSMTVQKGRLIAGKMLLVDFREGRIVSDEEIKRKYALKYPYGEWMKQYAVNLEELSIAMTDNDLRRELQLLGPPSGSGLPTAAAELLASVDHLEFYGVNSSSASRTRLSRSRNRGDQLTSSPDDDTQIAKTLEDLEEDPAVDLAAQLTMFGYTSERVDMLLSPMAKYAAEVLGSMGNDTPLACLSDLPKTPGDYFYQTFAQGTNPSIDPIRETDVMSLACPIGPQDDLFTVTRKHVKRIFLKRPVVNPSEFRALVTLPGFPTATVDLTVPRTSDIFDLEERLLQIQLEAEHAVREGSRVLILSDRRAGVDRLPIWSTIAVGAVHLHLIARRLRLNCAVVVETGEASEVHQVAMLLSSGADAVYPYVVYRALSRVQFRDGEDPLPLSRLIENYITAVHLGLLRVMSKIGVCTMLSYKGGFYFQPLGVSSSVLRLCYDCGGSAIGGVDFNVLAEDTLRFHLKAFPPRPLRPLVDSSVTPALQDSGDYRFVAVQEAELHSNHPDAILYLQKAARKNDGMSYQRFSQIQDALVDEIELRGQLDFAVGTYCTIPLHEVEPAKDIIKRFVTGAMSYGSIAEEAYVTIARAMNGIGSRSNTGEGGECEAVLNASDKSVRNRTKQIGSARFGVTAAYLCEADELQIKCGQGASPGEGEELPSYKVVGKVAAARRSTPGVGLISPPPHHDMYSIEDVAQMIMDLKHANPRARVSLKLVSKLGVGVIAAGCVKAKADHLVISGSSGGTAASKFSSIKHSGLPWEIGLAETHQTLCLNSLRERVTIQVDGGLRTGRDVMVAALLGAEEFGFGTQPLIALGCVMNRKCHLNACPAGIATQDPELRKRFKGQPEHLINYFFMVAEEVRQYMARLGIRQFNQMIGRSDLLRPKPRLKEHWKRAGLDFHQSLVPGWKLTCPIDRWRNGGEQLFARPMYCLTAQDHELDKVLDREIIRRTRRSLEHKLPTNILMPIRNGDRSVGGLLAYEVSTRYGATGLPADTIMVNFRGAAGQSFACWLPNGVTFHLSGDCNDFVGKGLCGGTVIVKPPSDSLFFPNSDQNIICGNAALYGATSGRAFFAGVAGERFAIRNSGAVAVVEGCGDYGCEYMTRGIILVLGRTGRSFGAGMTGGIAYVLDLDPHMINTQMVELQPLVTPNKKGDSFSEQDRTPEGCDCTDPCSAQHRRQTSSFDTATTIATASDNTGHGNETQKQISLTGPSTENVINTVQEDSGLPTVTLRLDETPCQLTHDAETVKSLLAEHFERTKSQVAARLLNEMPSCLSRFTKVFPKEIKRMLKQAISDYVTTGSPDAAALLDDWETMTTQASKHDAFYLQTLPYTLRTFAETYQRRERQRKRVEALDLPESALHVLGGLISPSPLEQYTSDLMRSGRLSDLLAEDSFDQLTQLMKMARTVYAHWRTGYSKGLRKSDSEMIKSLLPTSLTPARHKMIKKLLLEERRQWVEHLQALEGSPLAESLLSILEESPNQLDMRKSETLTDTNAAPQEIVTEEQDAETVLRDQSIVMYSGGEWEALVKRSMEVNPSTVAETPQNTTSQPVPANAALVTVKTLPQSAEDKAGETGAAALRRPFLARHPDRLRGFHLYAKQNTPLKNSGVRVLDWEEVAVPVNGTSRLFEQLMKTQASRCMDCGTPSCHYPNSDGSGGCPLGNRIPTWNSLVYDGQWKLALERLLDTNNFPEFTGRVCPAPCESSCLVTRTAPQMDGDAAQPVAIKSIEIAIIERGFQKGWIQPCPPLTRTSFTIAIIGSGPAGLAAAQQLNRAGHRVVVYEKEDRAGGLLMYGIPNMKLDKNRVVQRRIDLLEAEGITFKLNTTVGRDIMLDNLLDRYSAVLLATGQSKLLDLRIPGRSLKGIVQGLDFLKRTQKALLTHKDASVESGNYKRSSGLQSISQESSLSKKKGAVTESSSSQFVVDDVCGKRVIVIGSGEIAVDCIATAVRLGCSEIIQFCPDGAQSEPFFRVEYGHEEAMVLQGRDPREYCIQPLEFVPRSSPEADAVGGVRALRTSPSVPADTPSTINNRARRPEPIVPSRVPIKGTDRVYPADIVLLAMGFSGVDDRLWETSTTLPGRKNTRIRTDAAGKFIAPPREYRTNVKNLFACGDCRTGPSLVVSSIADGRDVARAIDDFLMQERHFVAGYQPRGIPIEWSVQQQPMNNTVATASASQQKLPTTPRKSRAMLLTTAQGMAHHVPGSASSIIKSESLPSIAPHLGFTEPTRTRADVSKGGASVFVPPPLKVPLASGPISLLPSALPLWTNPLRRYGRAFRDTCIAHEHEVVGTPW